MALSLAYVNEVLNGLDGTFVVDDQTWPILMRQLKFEGRDLEALVIGRMKLRRATGGYDGLMTTVDALLKENKSLRERVETLSKEKDALLTAEPEPANG